MSNQHNESERVPRGTREKYDHFVKDLENDIVDLFVVNSVLYHMGYLVIGKTELHEYTDRCREEVKEAHDATRIKLCKVTF